jgi:hypothetical protein
MLFACVAGFGCGPATGPGPEVPGGGAPQAARVQLALVPPDAMLVMQADVGRLYRRSAARDGEELFLRLVRQEEREVEPACVFDLAERVGWATSFFAEREDGPDGYGVLLETDATPEEIADCAERATGGEVRRVPPPPALSDAVALIADGETLALFAREDGTVVVADERSARRLLQDAPPRSILDDPSYRALAERLGTGEASFAWIERRERWRERGEAAGPRGLGGVFRAGAAPPAGEVVFLDPDPEEIGDFVEEMQEVRADVREEIEEAQQTLDGVRALEIAEADLDRVGRALDLVAQVVRRGRIVAEENAAVIELSLPEGTDVPAFLADLGYAAVVWLALTL